MKPLGKRARKILQKVIRRITDEPKRFDMGIWVTKWSGKDAPACGTVGCIAGWVALDKMTVREIAKMDDDRASDIDGTAWEVANKRLGISYEESRALFLPEEWPESFRSDLNRARSKAAKAEVAAKRIRHFIKTRE